MTILEIQRRHRRLGKLRMGAKGPKGEPRRINTWRLTSPNRDLIEQAADLWGGTVKPWDGDQYEVITEAKEIPVWVPDQRIETRLELWSAAGRQRLCDGETCWLTKGETLVEQPCLCNPENPECKLTTRFDFILPDLADLGVWGYESHGRTAAEELAGSIEMVAGRTVDAMLAIEERRPSKRKQFNVAVLRIKVTPRKILTGAADMPRLEAGRPALPAQSSVTVTEHDQGGDTALPTPVEPTDTPTVLDPEVEARRKEQIERLKAAAVEVGGAISTRKVGEAELETIVLDEDGVAPPADPPTTDKFDRFLHAVAAPLADEPEPEEDLEAEAAEADLDAHMAGFPNQADNMQTWEAWLRDLFVLMERAGIWVRKPHHRHDPLHAALARRQMQHVSDMKRAQLIDFTTKAKAEAEKAREGR